MPNQYNPNIHHRHSIRLQGYDYSQTGAYFVTICAHDRKCLFGEIADGVMHLNQFGNIVDAEWLKTPRIRPAVELDEYVIMPNHMHGIFFINDDGRGTEHRAPTVEQFGKPTHNSVPTIMRSYKGTVKIQINELRNAPGARVWQDNYYEHVIRDDEDLNRIREYIINNPMRWTEDENHPRRGDAC